jgi:hypothetical protein
MKKAILFSGFLFFLSAAAMGQEQKSTASDKNTPAVKKNNETVKPAETDISFSEEELKNRQQLVPLEMKAYIPEENNNDGELKKETDKPKNPQQ